MQRECYITQKFGRMDVIARKLRTRCHNVRQDPELVGFLANLGKCLETRAFVVIRRKNLMCNIKVPTLHVARCVALVTSVYPPQDTLLNVKSWKFYVAAILKRKT